MMKEKYNLGFQFELLPIHEQLSQDSDYHHVLNCWLYNILDLHKYNLWHKYMLFPSLEPTGYYYYRSNRPFLKPNLQRHSLDKY
jgi:hypothetical protein